MSRVLNRADFKVIKNLCKHEGITLKSLAEKINISETGLQRIIRTGSTKVETMENIAYALNTHIDVFYGLHLILLPQKDWVYVGFVFQLELMVLCKRLLKFSEKLSYYLDNFILNIFWPTNVKDKKNYGHNELKYLRYPYKIPGKPKYIFDSIGRNIPIIPKEIAELPFSKWPAAHQKLLKENKYLFENFYFVIFNNNTLNILDFLNDGLIKDKEIVTYWVEWKKHQHITQNIQIPEFIDAYTEKPYIEEMTLK